MPVVPSSACKQKNLSALFQNVLAKCKRLYDDDLFEYSWVGMAALQVT